MATAKIIDIADEPTTKFMMDGSQFGIDSTKLYPDNAELSQLAPRLSTPAHQTNPSLSPRPLLPTFLGEHLIPSPSVSYEALAQLPTGSIRHELGARPKRDRRPPEYYGIQMPQQQLTQSHSSRHSHSKNTPFTRSAPSLPVGSQVSQHSGSDHAPSLSDLQTGILKEKEKRDELEELKRQENKELDEQCKSIDEAARAAQNRQADAHKERDLSDRLT